MNRFYIHLSTIFQLFFNINAAISLCHSDWEEDYTDYEQIYKCIKVFPQKLDWYNAQIECEKYNSTLASILSDEENTNVTHYVNQQLYNLTEWWIGGFGKFGEIENIYWSWKDDCDFEYSCVKDGACENCCLTMDSTTKLWNVRKCDTGMYPFICEVQIQPNFPVDSGDSVEHNFDFRKAITIFVVLISFILFIIIVACCHPNCCKKRKHKITQKILKIEKSFKNSRIFVIINKIPIYKNMPQKETSVSNGSTETSFTSLTDISTSFHFDANMDIELANSDLSMEFMKLKEDGKVNRLTFPDDNKTYIFNMDDFECLGTLGANNIRQVKKYHHKPSYMKMAIKFLTIPQGRYGSDNGFKAILREIQNMKMLSECSSIVNFYGLCIHEEQALLCMELMDLSLRDLYHMIHEKKKKEFPERLVGYIFVKIVDALDFCKFKGVIHRDVKPCNILVNYSGKIKLCDFGESRILDNSLASTHVGTIAYWPPERFDYTYTKYDIRSDVWSLGITLMEIILGKLPYLQHENDAQKVENDVHKIVLPQYIIKTNYVEIIEKFIKPKYSTILCETLESCTRKLEERPKLEFLECTLFYEQSKLIEIEEIAKILQFERLI